MKCAACLLELGKQKPTLADMPQVGEEVTRIRGTSLCGAHAMKKMRQATVLAEMGFIPPSGLTTS